jgi:hypothetical protein
MRSNREDRLTGDRNNEGPRTRFPTSPHDRIPTLRHPVNLRPHIAELAGPAWARWSILRLNDLDQAGPVCSASPGRRLAGCRYASQIRETPPEASRHQARMAITASHTCAGCIGGPGLRHVSRRPAGWNRRRRERSGRRRRRADRPGPGPAARAVRLRAALNSSRQLAHTARHAEAPTPRASGCRGFGL